MRFAHAREAYTLALTVIVVTSVAAGATLPYASMAPIHAYLIAQRSDEIALARSAAPPAISRAAAVLILTVHGYDVAEPGSNGFTCLVERSWENAFDNAEFWNPKMRAPVCYNPAASRSVLPYTLFRTQLALSHASKAAILARLRDAMANKRLPPLEPGSMAYMMSKRQYLNDAAKAWHPHVMVYAPPADGSHAGASWGADRAGSPVILDTSDRVMPEPWTLFFIPVGAWSDAAPARYSRARSRSQKRGARSRLQLGRVLARSQAGSC